jgi:hypothetical protein
VAACRVVGALGGSSRDGQNGRFRKGPEVPKSQSSSNMILCLASRRLVNLMALEQSHLEEYANESNTAGAARDGHI